MIELLTEIADWMDANILPVAYWLYLAAALVWLAASILQP